MKLNLDQVAGLNLVTACGDQFVAINGERYESSLIVGPQLLDKAWQVSGFDALTEEAILALRAHQAVITLIGTGKRQRFPAPRLLRPLIEAQRGFEIMDTAAACRTYNILAGEGRSVIAALMLDPSS
ncbi:Mth938-like domain-containing protein [Niveibacterium sp. 24ML]|uniref:Mth938-like domain-containing protein n=1 Tax=Niveibacterium sp. 24ML TaxID=2985512 RepID=UPI00226E28C3|nr:Mth938-like domain-containing protein [Niveibacterium sp. 24ML]MCX9157206.1 Mth938-like domain-containing protein [Niveibacterium sp. 24ML]